MNEFERLLTQVRHCTECQGALSHDVRPVLQVHPNAKILIAGQAPGRKVHQSGIPFDDASGDRLRAWMGISKQAFYDPQQVAILPMGFCYPGTGKSGDLPPRSECAAKWRDDLLARLTNIELTLVIGQYAMAYHLPPQYRQVTAAVAAWQSLPKGVIALPHPSPRNNIWLKRNPWFSEQLLPQLSRAVADALAN